MAPIKKNQNKSIKNLFKKVFISLGTNKNKEKVKKVMEDINRDHIKKVLAPRKTKKILKEKKINKSIKINKETKKVSKKKIVNKVLKKIIKKDDILKPQKYFKLNKSTNNPIISPSLYDWESKATFNPTAFISDGIVHIIYRAIGEDDSSVLGYASSSDGVNIDERPTYFLYKRFINFNKEELRNDYSSGGSWNGGCEDPRITLIDDTLYLIYTAFDGWGSIRMALTSIKLSDFKRKKWNWKKTVLISPPGEINKNWVLFPEKINGKFAIMHSFYPNILVDYFDSLDELDGKVKFIKSNNTRPVDKSRTWDSWFRGVGPSPVRIKEGWLILYHAMDHTNPDRYRMGALILDSNDPTKVLYRSKNPIMEPEEDYENNGHKWGVIYSCGAIVKDDQLYVYYGGADKFVCVAYIKLSDLIENLKQNKIIKLKTVKNK